MVPLNLCKKRFYFVHHVAPATNSGLNKVFNVSSRQKYIRTLATIVNSLTLVAMRIGQQNGTV